MPIRAIIEKIRARPAGRQGKLSRKMIDMVLLAVLLFFALLLVLATIKKIQEGEKLTPSPSPTPTPVEEIFTPSSYATDSAVLAIEENIQSIEKDLLETDLYETGLNPPVLDMRVEFKE